MDTKKIGAFIAMNRKKKGYTQEQLAEKLGVTNKTISRWENRHYMPDLSLLEPLSKELDITLNELLAGEEIVKEEAMEYSEQNLIQTIDYTDKKIKDEHKKNIFIYYRAWHFLHPFVHLLFSLLKAAGAASIL